MTGGEGQHQRRAALSHRERLADLIKDARPDLPRRECKRRAVDIDVIQNGLWLTALLGLVEPSLRR